MPQTYTYDPVNPGPIDFVRSLIPDTEFLPDVSPPRMIFSDQELDNYFTVQRLSGFQSSMFFSGRQGRSLPSLPVSYYRVAAIALDVLANNKGKLGSAISVLDVKLDWAKASQALRDGAENYRKMDDESGSFVIIEQTSTDWAFADRWWNQFQRQNAGAGFSS